MTIKAITIGISSVFCILQCFFKKIPPNKKDAKGQPLRLSFVNYVVASACISGRALRNFFALEIQAHTSFAGAPN